MLLMLICIQPEGGETGEERVGGGVCVCVCVCVGGGIKPAAFLHAFSCTDECVRGGLTLY